MTKEQLLPFLLDNRVLSSIQEKALKQLFRNIASKKINERDSEDWFILGYQELKDENADEALETFDRAIELNEDFEAAYRFRASAYAMLEDYERAEKDATTAIEKDADYADAFFERATIYQAQKKWDKAVADADKVLQLDPEAIHARLLKGKILYDSGKYVDSIKEYDEVINDDPKNADAISSRGLAYFFSDKAEEALADIRKARMLEGGSIISEFNMGLACSAIPEKSKEAYRHLDKAFRKDGSLLIHYIQHTSSDESKKLIEKLNSIFKDLKSRKDDNFYTKELHDLLERKLKDANESLKKA